MPLDVRVLDAVRVTEELALTEEVELPVRLTEAVALLVRLVEPLALPLEVALRLSEIDAVDVALLVSDAEGVALSDPVAEELVVAVAECDGRRLHTSTLSTYSAEFSLLSPPFRTRNSSECVTPPDNSCWSWIHWLEPKLGSCSVLMLHSTVDTDW